MFSPQNEQLFRCYTNRNILSALLHETYIKSIPERQRSPEPTEFNCEILKISVTVPVKSIHIQGDQINMAVLSGTL